MKCNGRQNVCRLFFNPHLHPLAKGIPLSSEHLPTSTAYCGRSSVLPAPSVRRRSDESQATTAVSVSGEDRRGPLGGRVPKHQPANRPSPASARSHSWLQAYAKRLVAHHPFFSG